MPKVMTFATTFPANTLFAGEPTFFVGKIKSGEKIHTIRKGNRWKEGELFSPRIWRGKPYDSKQMEICKPLTIVKIYNFHFSIKKGWLIDGKYIDHELISLIAKNDGLRPLLLYDWLQPVNSKKPFDGQIICWKDPGYKI